VNQCKTGEAYSINKKAVNSNSIAIVKKSIVSLPAELGTGVKRSEVIYHHEVFNQMLWNTF